MAERTPSENDLRPNRFPIKKGLTGGRPNIVNPPEDENEEIKYPKMLDEMAKGGMTKDSNKKTTGAKETTQVVEKRKGGKVKKLVYGGVANPAIDQTQSYSSFAQQAPVMEAPAMDVGMSDPMSGYKDGGSVNIGKGKDYIKDLL